METRIPKLRADLDIIPVSYQGQRAFVVKDTLGLIEKPVLLHGEVLEMVGLIDGRRSVRDIQLAIIRQRKGELVSSEELDKILQDLDSLFLMESEHFRSQREKIMNDYARLRIRPAALAGRSYPESAGELEGFVGSLLHQDGEIQTKRPERKVRALVAPHIDLSVGKKVYASAYGAIRGMTPEHIVLLGTGHGLSEHFFALTDKDFETPLGSIKTDREWVDVLKRIDTSVLAQNDFSHRSEHSIEFQLIFLQHLFGSAFSLVPILCGSFHEPLSSFAQAADIPGVRDVLCELGRLIGQDAEKTLVIAGVDFSHIGLKFGHDRHGSTLLSAAKKHDNALIKAFCQGDARSFWAEVKQVDNYYNVCGFSALACLMALFPGAQGECLDYAFWEEEATQSAVSFAAIVLFG